MHSAPDTTSTVTTEAGQPQGTVPGPAPRRRAARIIAGAAAFAVATVGFGVLFAVLRPGDDADPRPAGTAGTWSQAEIEQMRRMVNSEERNPGSVDPNCILDEMISRYTPADLRSWDTAIASAKALELARRCA